MIFLLRSKDYFNVPKNQLGTVSNDLIFYGMIMQIIGVFFIGPLFDMFSRRWTIFIAMLFASGLMVALPNSPNIYPWAIIFRMGIYFMIVAPQANPLVNDYVKKESRGRAVAF